MRGSLCLALAASILHGKVAGLSTHHLCSLGSQAHPRRLGRPAPGRIGDSRLLLRAAGGAAGEGEPRHFWAALLGRPVRAGGASPPAFTEQPARLLSSPEVSFQGEFQRKLYKDLVKNYNSLERPVANDSLPLTVYFSLSLLQIMDVVVPAGPGPARRRVLLGFPSCPGRNLAFPGHLYAGTRPDLPQIRNSG